MILGPVNHGYDRNNLEHEAMPQSDLRVAIGGELRGCRRSKICRVVIETVQSIIRTHTTTEIALQ